MIDPNFIWAVGIFEGEGYMGKRSVGNSARMFVSMTDKDIVERFQAAVGCGTISIFRPPAYKDHWQDQWRWYLGKKKEVINLIERMLPYLGLRRAYNALNILDDLELGLY